MKSPAVIKLVARFVPFVLFAVAIAIVHHEVKAHNPGDILDAMRAVPLPLWGLAIILTIVNYLVLAGYDWLALRYTGHSEISLRRILGVSMIGYGISNNTGHSWASGGAIRYRFYTSCGVPGWDIAKISLFLGLTYVIGVLTLGAVCGLSLPPDLRGAVDNPQVLSVVTYICIFSLLGYWGAVLFLRRPLKIKGVEVGMPPFSLAIGQSIISSLDLILASSVLWVFLKDVPGMDFSTFLMIYVMAQVVGLVSQVPGGLGVFEGAFFWLAGPNFTDSHAQILAALVLYRVVYFFLPLAVAGAMLFLHELHDNRGHIVKIGKAISSAFAAFVPRFFSILLFAAGAILLVSGSVPPIPQDMHWLSRFIPVTVIEISHLLGSVTGILLLFLARAVRLKLDAAWYGSLVLLALGVAVSLLKDWNLPAATVLGLLFCGMLLARRYFYRKSSLLDVSLDWSWVLLIAIVVAGSVWLGFFSYKHVEYHDDLWWQFSYKSDASRFLRSLVVIGVTIIALSFMRLMSVSRPRSMPIATKDELAEAEPLVRNMKDAQAFLALLGDKSLFWSEDRKAFLAYAAKPGTWIVMGDPVGDPDSFESLLWRFREEADQYAAKAVFYQVTEDRLPLYLDLGLTLLKIGQDARVKLADFTLEGKKRANLRTSRNKMERLNYRFEVLTQQELEANIARLQMISDLWLTQKNVREKGFSLGFFEPSYVSRTCVAVVRDEMGRIMAFANLWALDNKEELAIDLMRYDPESPACIMDYLFAELMLWSKEQGYRWFNLGVAPLSGLERHPLAPLWHKIGTAIFDLGEEFYNFEGLYQYKAKYDPEWQARYLAVPPGIGIPAVLIKVTALISGGLRGVFSR